MLFELPAQRHRRQRAEDWEVFEAVVKLRAAGRQVYSAGRHHQVDGRLLSSGQLLLLASVIAGHGNE